jgi:BirA family biotin operon repressor/biotin-[acetyl-CoA-carboxylase] ligase
VWVSPPGNLYASTIVRLRPADPPAPTLALVAAVALNEVASNFAPLQLKWPNDLMAGGAKLAGILLERAGDGVVIGFGANLAHHPSGLERPVTSIAALTGTAPDPEHFLSLLAERLAVWLARWRGEGIAPVCSAWLKAAHPLGTALATPEGEGLFDGLDADGGLRLLLAGGDRRTIHAGDVFLI